MAFEIWLNYYYFLMQMFTLPIKPTAAENLRQNIDMQRRRIDDLEKKFYSTGL